MTLPGEVERCLIKALPPLNAPPRPPFSDNRITAVQARMAGAALGISQGDVAKFTGCAIKTVYLFEQNAALVSRKNANVFRAYYESLGILFIDDATAHIVAAYR